MKNKRSISRILKRFFVLIAFVLILSIAFFLALPPLLSSNLVREKIAACLTKDLKRPVAINTLSFSWRKGLKVSGVDIKNNDASPFLNLKDLQCKISWRALVTWEINIQVLNIQGIELTVTRDKSGKTNLSELLKDPSSKERSKQSSKFFPALFLEAHIKDGTVTFIDQRLNTKTQLKNLFADLSLRSLTEPMKVFLKTDIALNDEAPEPFELNGTFHLFPQGKFDLQKVRAALAMKASFGNVHAFFDLATFSPTGRATGARLSCFLDLNKLARFGAGILGFPSGFSLQGQLQSTLEAKGTIQCPIQVNGETLLTGLSIAGGPFKDAPFNQPQLILIHDFVYSPEQNSVTFRRFKADAPLFNLEGVGTIFQVSNNPWVKCEGKLFFDLAEAQKILSGFFPKKLTTQGKGTFTFAGEGNLRSHENKPVLSSWNGRGSLSLDSLISQGLGSIQNLKSTELALTKGVLHSTLECLLNNGPSKVQGTIDFNREKPEMKINLEGKEVQLSQDQMILGYLIPISIASHSSPLTGKGNFCIQASWQGTHWEPEISKTVIGQGSLNVNEGSFQNSEVLSLILKALGKPETIQFAQILTTFRLAESKIYNDTIQVKGKDLKIALKGWTSLTYDPFQKGNPIEYTVSEDSLKQSLGKDAKKILALLGGEGSAILISITGTLQKPKVSIKMPKGKDLLQRIFSPPKNRSAFRVP